MLPLTSLFGGNGPKGAAYSVISQLLPLEATRGGGSGRWIWMPQFFFTPTCSSASSVPFRRASAAAFSLLPPNLTYNVVDKLEETIVVDKGRERKIRVIEVEIVDAN